MPSRVNTRVRLEHASRAISILVVAVVLWQSFQEHTDGKGETSIERRLDASKLTEWSAEPNIPDIQVQLERVPSEIDRAWLAALNGAGRRVTWVGDLPFLMIGAQPIVSPVGGTTVSVAAPSGASVAVNDRGGIDTVPAQRAGTQFTLGSAANHVTAAVNGSVASTAQRDSVLLRKLLVIGQPGWESKFVVAALEEDGWKVDPLIRVAPGVDITQGSTAVIDTSRYSAVIALDAAATSYANRMMEFARVGGGVVLASRAASLDAMAGLRAGTIARTPSEARAPAPAPRTIASLPLAPITSYKSDAVPLERRSEAVATAARRIGGGRALQVGYEDTWRWRMSGDDGAVFDHRHWWTGIVSSVAYSPRVPRSAAAGSTDEAPMIGLVAAIGAAAQRGDVAILTGAASNWTLWLLVLLTLALISEVASRRLRGAS